MSSIVYRCNERFMGKSHPGIEELNSCWRRDFLSRCPAAHPLAKERKRSCNFKLLSGVNEVGASLDLIPRTKAPTRLAEAPYQTTGGER